MSELTDKLVTHAHPAPHRQAETAMHIETLPAQRVDIGSIVLNVIDVGNGPAVLLLHGFPDRASMWSSQIRYLAERGYRVIAPDLRGFGDSDRPDGVENYSTANLVGDIAALLATLQIPKAIVVGHDWGAILAWAFAASMPHLAHKLVAISVGHPRAFFAAGDRQRQLSWYMLLFCTPGVVERVLPTDNWRWWRNAVFGGADPSENKQLATQIKDLSRPGALESALNYYRANFSAETFVTDDPAAAVPNIACPALGIWSDGDVTLTREQMVESEKFVDGEWSCAILPGIGHWVPTEAASAVNELLSDFCACP